jgi:hypothetical protein
MAVHLINVCTFALLLCEGLSGCSAFLVAHSGRCSLLHHGKNLRRFHVQHFCDAALHDEKVWVVDIEGHRLKKILHFAAYQTARFDGNTPSSLLPHPANLVPTLGLYVSPARHCPLQDTFPCSCIGILSFYKMECSMHHTPARKRIWLMYRNGCSRTNLYMHIRAHA